MVIAGSRQYVKIHIHTNYPGKLFKMCSVYGNVDDRKVDDMTKQERTIHHLDGGGIAIVVDSGADIPDEYINEIEESGFEFKSVNMTFVEFDFFLT